MTEPDRTYPDCSYMDELTIALRVRDVPGARIGEVLAEVRAHIAESGESPRGGVGMLSPEAAFGIGWAALGLVPAFSPVGGCGHEPGERRSPGHEPGEP